MEKMKMESIDGVQSNIEKIAELFPNCITEALDTEKSTSEKPAYKKAVNWKMLRQMLSGDLADENESYEMTWVGKKAAIVEANKPIRKTLRPCPEESVNWDTTENLYIEGDNLEVLKLLQESYLGKIKMIYIDPPYNTGSDFIYPDKFVVDKKKFLEDTNYFDEDGNINYSNSNSGSNGRFHSDWLNMIYSRLLVAKNLLTPDGVIFISIDDSEQENLKKVCNEIFGEANFIGPIVRNTNSSKNQSLFISVSHEYCLVYAKDIETLKQKHANNKWCVEKNNIKEYKQKVEDLKKQGLSPEEITEELKILTKYPRFIDFTNYWYFDSRGLYRKDNLGGVKNGNSQPLMNPITREYDPVPPGGFRYSPEKLNELVADNRIHFHTDGSLPTIKRYLSENEMQRPKSIMSDDQRPDGKLLERYETPFDNPKQLAFIERICSIEDNDAIFLDFFGGSSTTAEAVIKLNEADGGKRKFIIVQLSEPCNSKSKAYKLGYKTISDLGRERIRKAGQNISQSLLNKVDIGFRSFHIDSSNMKDIYFHPGDMKQDRLFDLESNIKEDRSDLDLFFGCVLDWGLPLSLPYSTETIGGFKIHNYNNGDLIACFEENVSEELVKEIASRQPMRAVFRDSSFGNSPEKINIFEIFKKYMPEDADDISKRVKVI